MSTHNMTLVCNFPGCETREQVYTGDIYLDEFPDDVLEDVHYVRCLTHDGQPLPEPPAARNDTGDHTKRCTVDCHKRPAWMGVDQYDAHQCVLNLGHDGPHVCSTADEETALAAARNDTGTPESAKRSPQFLVGDVVERTVRYRAGKGTTTRTFRGIVQQILPKNVRVRFAAVDGRSISPFVQTVKPDTLTKIETDPHA